MDARQVWLSEVAQHCDFQERLAVIPPSARYRGLYVKNVELEVEQAGQLERYRELFPERYRAMSWYPASEFLVRLVAGAAMVTSPEQVHRGMAQIGRRNAVAFAESLLGRMVLRLLARDPVKLLRQGLVGQRQGSTHGTWTLELTGETSATMHMRDEYMYIESYYAGAAMGTFEAIGMQVDVRVELDDRYNGRHLLTW